MTDFETLIDDYLTSQQFLFLDASIKEHAAGLLGDVEAKQLGFTISLYLDAATRQHIDEFGTSKPIVPFPGTGATILTDWAFIASAILSLSEVILWIFTPGAGSSS